jgi:8-oxo-dGTP diphosphatase
VADHPKPSVTADVAVFAGRGDGLRLLLVRRGRDPYAGVLALPGGFADEGESLEQTAARELEEETGVRDGELRQVGTYSDPGRDPRGWVISTCFLARLDEQADARAADDAVEVRWELVSGLLDRIRAAEEAGERLLAFDHDRIVRDAVRRLDCDCA